MDHYIPHLLLLRCSKTGPPWASLCPTQLLAHRCQAPVVDLVSHPECRILVAGSGQSCSSHINVIYLVSDSKEGETCCERAWLFSAAAYTKTSGAWWDARRRGPNFLETERMVVHCARPRQASGLSASQLDSSRPQLDYGALLDQTSHRLPSAKRRQHTRITASCEYTLLRIAISVRFSSHLSIPSLGSPIPRRSTW